MFFQLHNLMSEMRRRGRQHRGCATERGVQRFGMCGPDAASARTAFDPSLALPTPAAPMTTQRGSAEGCCRAFITPMKCWPIRRDGQAGWQSGKTLDTADSTQRKPGAVRTGKAESRARRDTSWSLALGTDDAAHSATVDRMEASRTLPSQRCPRLGRPERRPVYTNPLDRQRQSKRRGGWASRTNLMTREESILCSAAEMSTGASGVAATEKLDALSVMTRLRESAFGWGMMHSVFLLNPKPMKHGRARPDPCGGVTTMAGLVPRLARADLFALQMPHTPDVATNPRAESVPARAFCVDRRSCVTGASCDHARRNSQPLGVYCGIEQRSARRAHNSEVGGSNPSPANFRRRLPGMSFRGTRQRRPV